MHCPTLMNDNNKRQQWEENTSEKIAKTIEQLSMYADSVELQSVEREIVLKL